MYESTRAMDYESTAKQAAISALSGRFGDRVATSRAICEQHGHSTTWLPTQPPDAVVFPRSESEVQEIVGLCGLHRVPIIPFGSGTSFEGQVNAPYGGVCIDFRDMNRVLSVHAEDHDCVVEPGITRQQLNRYLRDQGLFFPVDPGAEASIGGMASTRASGTTAVRYGTMKDAVLSLKVVLANGELISTARRARKSSSGYDLTRLIIGAEGTLGVITELTLRLQGIPEAIAAAVCQFPSMALACDAAIASIQAGLPMARIEFLDEVQVRASNAHSGLDLSEAPMLFVEFNGSEAAVAEQSELFGEIARDHKATSFEWASNAEARSRLWKARHDAFWAMTAFRKGASVVVTDACVPISRLAECVVETRADLDRSNLVAPIVGHVGDGNFHCGVAVMMEDKDEVLRTRDFIQRLAERCLRMDGTCTGEHGIGQGKMAFLEPEHGPGAVEAMRAIKRALDPRDIMNPGKIV